MPSIKSSHRQNQLFSFNSVFARDEIFTRVRRVYRTELTPRAGSACALQKAAHWGQLGLKSLKLAFLRSLLVLHALMAPAFAAEEEPTMQVVFVPGTIDPDWKSYKAFLVGMDLFEAKQKLAPEAPLRFVLRPRKEKARVAGVTMSIDTDDGQKIAVPVALDGTFSLPRSEQAAQHGGEIVLSKKRNTLSWRPSIHSPGVPSDARRLGDLRLECFVRWSIEQADLLALFRGAINAFGGPCTSAAIKVDYISDKPIAAAYLEFGERREKLAATWIEGNGHVYLPPVHDSSWPDDTLVYFEFVKTATR